MKRTSAVLCLSVVCVGSAASLLRLNCSLAATQGHFRSVAEVRSTRAIQSSRSREDVEESVLRYLFSRYGATQHYPAYHIGWQPPRAPQWSDFGHQFMLRFRNDRPPVRRISRLAHEVREHRAVDFLFKDRVTGARAITFIIQSVTFPRKAMALVNASAQWDRQGGEAVTCTVSRRAGTWLTVGASVTAEF